MPGRVHRVAIKVLLRRVICGLASIRISRQGDHGISWDAVLERLLYADDNDSS